VVIIHYIEFLQGFRHHVFQIGGNNGVGGDISDKSVLSSVFVDGTSKSSD